MWLALANGLIYCREGRKQQVLCVSIRKPTVLPSKGNLQTVSHEAITVTGAKARQGQPAERATPSLSPL